MDKIRNLSVRKTILLYMAVALICSYILSVFIVGIATRTQMNIWWKYVDKEAFIKEVESKGPYSVTNIPRPNRYEMTKSDCFVTELCDFLETYTILILSMAGSCAAVFLFYRNKLKNPIEELALASKKIAGNNLDFNITYESKDEMGVLCMEFERMREQLARNNRILWKNIEEEKLLRAAIAHDIRSPLSVLKGYQEMLTEYLPSAEIDMEQAMEMLSESRRQIERMDTFVEAMRKMSSLENREPAAGKISAGQLETDIRAEITILEKEYGKKCILLVPKSDEIFCGDKEIVLEVTENLLSNALRYCKNQVEIMVNVEYSELSINVSDDGEGFKEDAEKITEAFYGQNAKDSLKHAGIGMYISRMYCEKHGGKLVLENDEQEGAVVTAIFRRIV
ncbi:MAG: HAMP domain-containing histidine kinase [Lachnospiraceae bacterium]|nr:HAMP domain-containing histidine kinase [Lachnospiraceae bacterium]